MVKIVEYNDDGVWRKVIAISADNKFAAGGLWVKLKGKKMMLNFDENAFSEISDAFANIKREKDFAYSEIVKIDSNIVRIKTSGIDFKKEDVAHRDLAAKIEEQKIYGAEAAAKELRASADELDKYAETEANKKIKNKR